MNLRISVAILSVLLAVPPAFADQAPTQAPQPPKHGALPPPSMTDKGVAEATPVETDTDPLELTKPDTRLVRDKASRNKEQSADEIRATSSVTRRQEGSDTVEESREKGRLRMIRVLPQTGPEQIYMDTNGDGRLERDPRDGPVSPVYFKIYEWN